MPHVINMALLKRHFTVMTLRYQTNSAHFDFPEIREFPAIRYVIASSPRCGSNLLQRALWRSGLAGAPEEYLTDAYPKDFAMRWDISDGAGGVNAEQYLRILMRFRTSPNSVFGLKVHGSHLSNSFLKRLDLGQQLEQPIYILIRRRNKFLQAVSYLLARQTGVWILDGAWLPDKEAVTSTPTYSLPELLACLEGIIQEESEWDRYFADRHITPYTVIYEELVANYETVTAKVLSHLGIYDFQGHITEPGIKRQATTQNAEWAERFERDLKSAHDLYILTSAK